MSRILLTSTSYPRSVEDWQGLFIREMLAALSRLGNIDVSYWGPAGPLPDGVHYLGSESDQQFLEALAAKGGIAQLLRSKPLRGLANGAGLIRRLRRVLRERRQTTDLLHLNWLQSALALPGRGSRALVTVLGTDYKLLDIPGVAALLRQRIAGNRVVLAPNAEWMVPRLTSTLGGEGCRIAFVPLGIDPRFYEVQPDPAPARQWITVLRVTRAKLGPLLAWARPLAAKGEQFHLFGPLQETMTLPSWLHYHGAVTPDTLIRDWYPQATAMVTLSQHDEGRPQVLLEAMAAGVPIIASRLPAHVDLLESAGGGILVDSEDEFGAAIDRLSDPAMRSSLAASARSAIAASYGNWDDCARRYERLYEQLLRDDD